MQLINYIQILRPLNLLISALCVLLSAFILNQLTVNLLPIILVVLLLAGFSNILNDIIDYKIDTANNLDRPISSNLISIKAAILYAILLLLFGCIIAFTFNSITKSLIFFAIIPLLILYTPIFKKIPLIGNLVVSFILSMVFVITSTYLLGEIDYAIIPPMILSFFLMLIREIVKDIADLEGDKTFNINTLPVKFGIDIAVLFIYLFTFLLFIASILVYYVYDLYNLFYLVNIFIFIHCPLFFSIYQLSKNKTSIYCIYLSKVLKLLTIFGVIVIYLVNN
tara:strand:+ start:1457 stop:2296 length:840 start_codon:yes stop_codon:yes gene_type:complete